MRAIHEVSGLDRVSSSARLGSLTPAKLERLLRQGMKLGTFSPCLRASVVKIGFVFRLRRSHLTPFPSALYSLGLLQSRARTLLTNPIQTIKDLTQSALGDIHSAATLADLEKVRVAVLGRKGELAGISKTFGAMAPEDRAKAGQLLNEAKATLEKSIEDRKASLEGSEADQRYKSEWIDLTVPPRGTAPGNFHPVPQVQDGLEQLSPPRASGVLEGRGFKPDYYNLAAL